MHKGFTAFFSSGGALERVGLYVKDSQVFRPDEAQTKPQLRLLQTAYQGLLFWIEIYFLSGRYCFVTHISDNEYNVAYFLSEGRGHPAIILTMSLTYPIRGQSENLSFQ